MVAGVAFAFRGSAQVESGEGKRRQDRSTLPPPVLTNNRFRAAGKQIPSLLYFRWLSEVGKKS